MIKELIDNKDYRGIELALSAHPQLANEGLPYDEVNPAKAHPLHRICDGVFSGKYTDEEAVEMARIFLKYGADINGGILTVKQDTPLVAASSLDADLVAIFYIENGAGINHQGTHGGTALHWASRGGRYKVVSRLVQEGAEVNKQCIDFSSTPLFWAVHGLKNSADNDAHNHLECIRILLQSGADKSIPNIDGNTVFDLFNEEDAALKEILSKG